MKRKIILLCTVSVIMLILSGCDTNEGSEEVKEKELAEQAIVYEETNKATVYEQIKEVAEELNENSNLYINLLTFASETEYASYFDIEEIRQTPPDEQMPNMFDIKYEGNTIGSGAVRPFPWTSDNLLVVHMSWDMEELYHVFGIDVGDRLEEARGVLSERGYVIDDSNPQSNWHAERYGRRTTYIKEYVAISFIVCEDGQKIIRINVSVRDPFIPLMDVMQNEISYSKYTEVSE